MVHSLCNNPLLSEWQDLRKTIQESRPLWMRPGICPHSTSLPCNSRVRPLTMFKWYGRETGKDAQQSLWAGEGRLTLSNSLKLQLLIITYISCELMSLICFLHNTAKFSLLVLSESKMNKHTSRRDSPFHIHLCPCDHSSHSLFSVLTLLLPISSNCSCWCTAWTLFLFTFPTGSSFDSVAR